MTGQPDFASWRLHDAVLDSVRFDWNDKACVITLMAFLEVGRDAQPCELRFSGVTLLALPCSQPWGPSAHVNGQTQTDGNFVIQMQSGDEIQVTARSVQLVRK